METDKEREERWTREYEEENDPDPWGDLDSCGSDSDDGVEDWELLGLDPDTPQDEIDQMWENQM